MSDNDKKNIEWAKGKISREQGEYDVIVFGEEPDGIAAAVSSARAGAKTLLIAQHKNLGGVVAQSLLTDLEPGFGAKNKLLNKGFYSELYNRLGRSFSAERYISVVNSIAGKEKNLDILYDVRLQAPLLEDNTIKGVSAVINNGKRNLYGKVVIDASREGNVLSACGVPFFRGSEDLNIKDCYEPAEFSFMVEGISPAQISTALKDSEFYNKIKKYRESDLHIYSKNIKIVSQGSNRAVITGMEIWGLNVRDRSAVNLTYKNAVNEAAYLTEYLKSNFEEFKGIKLLGTAGELYLRESVHFIGEHVLSIADILENRDYADKIAIGSRPVDGSKLARNSYYTIGKPEQYAVPLGCIIPLKIENLLMVGPKASYSSLAASSAGAMSVSIAEGQCAGIISVFSIVKNIKPRDLVKQDNEDLYKEIKLHLEEQGISMPDFNIKAKNEGQWAYPYLKQLIHLGLVAGGTDNDFGLEDTAASTDFTTLLLNGVYRLAPEKYSLELDSRLRKYFTDEKLTGEKAAEILLVMYNKSFKAGSAFKTACDNGYIDGTMRLRLKQTGVLKMEDIFYLSCYNIKRFTQKSIL